MVSYLHYKFPFCKAHVIRFAFYRTGFVFFFYFFSFRSLPILTAIKSQFKRVFDSKRKNLNIFRSFWMALCFWVVKNLYIVSSIQFRVFQLLFIIQFSLLYCVCGDAYPVMAKICSGKCVAACLCGEKHSVFPLKFAIEYTSLGRSLSVVILFTRFYQGFLLVASISLFHSLSLSLSSMAEAWFLRHPFNIVLWIDHHSGCLKCIRWHCRRVATHTHNIPLHNMTAYSW